MRALIGWSALVAATGACGGSGDTAPAVVPDASATDAVSETDARSEGAPDGAPEGAPDGGPGAAPDGARDATIDPYGPGLRLNQIRMRGTHNSYHLRPDNLLPDWQYDHLPLDQQLNEQRVRQFELDVHFKPDGFRVFHLPAVDARSTCDRFTDCVAVLLAWSEAHRGHVPLVVLVEPKDDVDPTKVKDHLPELEAELRLTVPPDRLLTPDDVRGDFADVRTAITTRGWPVLAAVRGRLLFVLLDHGETREAQLALHPGSAGGVFFVPGPEDEPASAFLLLDDASGDEARITAAVQAGFMVRTMAGEDHRVAPALRSGAHCISTDTPLGIPIEPGGGPGCNPVTAGDDCEAVDLEPGVLSPR